MIMFLRDEMVRGQMAEWDDDLGYNLGDTADEINLYLFGA